MLKDKIVEWLDAEDGKHYDYGDPRRDLFSDWNFDCSEMPKPEGVNLSLVDSYGGEDCGTYIQGTWKAVGFGEELYFRVYGSYYSHDGSYYEGYEFVKPKQQTITVFE